MPNKHAINLSRTAVEYRSTYLTIHMNERLIQLPY